MRPEWRSAKMVWNREEVSRYVESKCSERRAVNEDNLTKEASKDNSCPRCQSGNMIEHPSPLTMPMASKTATRDISKIAIEDQDANFVFRFVSCSSCGYSEFYLVGGGTAKKRL